MPQPIDVAGGFDYSRLADKLQAFLPVIYNVTLILPNTQYSQLLPTGTKKFTVKERNGNPFRLAFLPGMVALPLTSYVNVLANQVYWEDYVYLTGITIYLAAPAAGRVIEIITWR